MRVTRGAAAKEAALADTVGKCNRPEELPVKATIVKKAAAAKKATVTKPERAKVSGDGEATAVSAAVPAPEAAGRKVSTAAKSKGPAKGKSMANKSEYAEATAKTELPTATKKSEKPSVSATASKRRKRATAPKVEEDPDELPHGMGKLWKPSSRDVQTESSGLARKEQAEQEVDDVAEPAVGPIDTPASAEPPPSKKQRARGKVTPKSEEAIASVADPAQPSAIDASGVKDESPSKKSPRKKANP
ncbi:MAG: hypothetical protein Q9184_008247, partial [Pyrenodesmia sp. 2 TL-2023]